MTNKITIVKNGEQQREYNFQTLDDDTAKLATELILRQSDNIIAVLDEVNAINADNPPTFEDIPE